MSRSYFERLSYKVNYKENFDRITFYAKYLTNNNRDMVYEYIQDGFDDYKIRIIRRNNGDGYNLHPLEGIIEFIHPDGVDTYNRLFLFNSDYREVKSKLVKDLLTRSFNNMSRSNIINEFSRLFQTVYKFNKV